MSRNQSGFMLSLLSLAGRGKQSFASLRWEVGSGLGQHRHYIRRRGKGTPAAPWRWLEGKQLAVWQSKWLHFRKDFLSVITTGAHGFFLCKAASGHWGNLTVGERGSRKLLRANQAGFSLLHSQTRRECLGGSPRSHGQKSKPLALLSWLPTPGDAGGSSGTLVLNNCLLSIWCDAKALQQSTSERKEQQFNSLFLS